VSAVADPPRPAAAKPALQSVSIALGVLEALAVAPELSLSELARRVGVAKSTAHRTCAVLTGAGLLTRTEAGKYRLGLRLIEYGQLATARSPVGEHGLPLLAELRTTLGETVQIGVPAGGDVVYVERVEGVRAIRYSSDNTRRGPVHRSSAGKVLAAFVPGVMEARLKGWPSAEHRLHDRGPRRVQGRAREGSLARLRPQCGRDRDRDGLVGRPRALGAQRAGRGSDLDGRPHVPRGR
jgi:DNA-binding IclR family transcriptional regulator